MRTANRQPETRNARRLALSLLTFSFCLLPFVAPAQSSIPREDTWVTDGAVTAIARTTDTVYIGGFFTWVGPSSGGGGRTRWGIAALEA